jgi:hypothetical protein
MIDSAVEAADRFHPAFDFLLKGKTADDAMAGLHVRDRRRSLGVRVEGRGVEDFARRGA